MMNYDKLTLNEIRNGYYYNPKEKAYTCRYCGQAFQSGHIYPINGEFFRPEQAAAKHIEADHRGQLWQLLNTDSPYNTLTDTQKELLSLLHLGLSEDQIADKMDIAVSKVRRQKYALREKAKQAKLYLAIFECAFGDETVSPL